MMKNKIQIDLPQINWILNYIGDYGNQAIASRKFREMAADPTPIKKQCEEMIKHPSDLVELQI